jgi:hypothetical protein
LIKYQVTYTDTFSGEANFCWVNRFEVQANTLRGAIRKAKAHLNLTGWPCETTDFGNEAQLQPKGMNTILFVVEDYQ